MYDIKELPDVKELHGESWYYYTNRGEVGSVEAIMWAKRIFQAVEEHGSVLIYCETGAKKSGAAALLLLGLVFKDMPVLESYTFSFKYQEEEVVCEFYK